MSASANLPAHAILIGRGPWTDKLENPPDWKALGDEGFLLRTDGDRVIIAGSPVRGAMYGCYEFLEKLGVRWYTPTYTSLPHDPRSEGLLAGRNAEAGFPPPRDPSSWKPAAIRGTARLRLNSEQNPRVGPIWRPR